MKMAVEFFSKLKVLCVKLWLALKFMSNVDSELVKTIVKNKFEGLHKLVLKCSHSIAVTETARLAFC